MQSGIKVNLEVLHFTRQTESDLCCTSTSKEPRGKIWRQAERVQMSSHSKQATQISSFPGYPLVTVGAGSGSRGGLFDSTIVKRIGVLKEKKNLQCSSLLSVS